MAHTYQWSCPLCEKVDGFFERQTELGLTIAVATHIINHEERAGLRAVDRARLTCCETSCSLGKNRKLDPDTQEFVPRLTEYDRKFLSGVRIKIE